MSKFQVLALDTPPSLGAVVTLPPPYTCVVNEGITDQGLPFAEVTAGKNTLTLHVLDYLRNSRGEPVQATSDAIITYLKKLNAGRQYGRGYEKSLFEAVRDGRFENGDFILAPAPVLSEVVTQSKTNPALERIKVPEEGIFVLSSTEPGTETGYTNHIDLVNADKGKTRTFSKQAPGRILMIRGYYKDGNQPSLG